jgi:hypothetical protein|tara:strand:- start:53939 stop:54178 length:240 start_codon:yes stop_codon:yes gene_type:complete
VSFGSLKVPAILADVVRFLFKAAENKFDNTVRHDYLAAGFKSKFGLEQRFVIIDGSNEKIFAVDWFADPRFGTMAVIVD